VSKVRLQANSIDSTSALLPLSLLDVVVVIVVVCVEVLLADIAPDSTASRTGAARLPPLGGVVWMSATSVEDDGSAGCGDGGAEGL